jgi:hypothetical protein
MLASGEHHSNESTLQVITSGHKLAAEAGASPASWTAATLTPVANKKKITQF